jgi:hypothetical protein
MKNQSKKITITAEAQHYNSANHKWALDSRQRWLTMAVQLEEKLNDVHVSVTALRARSLKKTLSAELDKIIAQLEA